jgi:hypothetical protein
MTRVPPPFTPEREIHLLLEETDRIQAACGVAKHVAARHGVDRMFQDIADQAVAIHNALCGRNERISP